MKECSSSRKGSKPIDDCIPIEYDSNGWPLGTMCSIPGCGGWICSNPEHSYISTFRNKKIKVCRVCSVGLKPS